MKRDESSIYKGPTNGEEKLQERCSDEVRDSCLPISLFLFFEAPLRKKFLAGGYKNVLIIRLLQCEISARRIERARDKTAALMLRSPSFFLSLSLIYFFFFDLFLAQSLETRCR